MVFPIVIITYLVFLISVAIVKSKRIKGHDDFMVAGRTVPVSMLVGTLVCTWIGSGSLFGGSGLAFRVGFSDLWQPAGAWIGIIVVYFLAGRVRRIAEYTVPDLLEKRYNSAARIFGTIVVIVAYVCIAGYQFRGGGRLITIITNGDISPELGAVITCCIIIFFTMIAGMVSIVSIDVFNGIIMITGIAIAIPLALKSAGGWSDIVQSLPKSHFTVFGDNDFKWAMGMLLPTLFLLLGESSMYQKFFSAKNEKAARQAVIGMVIGVVVIETLLIALAVIGSGIYWNDPAFRAADGTLINSVTEEIALRLAFMNVGVIGGSLLLGAAVAIILSTGNTFLMIPSTNVTRDLYHRYFRPNASEKEIVRFQRIMILVLGLLALAMSTRFTYILSMAYYAYVMVGAGLTPAILACFLWKRVTPMGGLTSILGGMIATVLSQFIFHLEVDQLIYPALAVSLVCLFGVSLLTKPSPEEKWSPFFNKK
ncbi:MAG: sodium:solute symporter family protein [Candidatus Latescibacteria bacterium]|nr:sodium:solute symporter family protein [Candidatus Latescibacterota bacterium]NIO28428.1 sodium:solute symporter family protein [Candidatus Latescibacterota bacterium]NIO55977.1 sodium:solute symporter family protein [Candidatus Latescibacterota bacterium]NIT01941.1 sodium:solute symporter family protein [Candidatus Latescibacterota bacterium]